jgi:hypothetical protein
MKWLLTGTPSFLNEFFFCSVFKGNQCHFVINTKHGLIRVIFLWMRWELKDKLNLFSMLFNFKLNVLLHC